MSLIISLPFSLASSIYMTEIATPQRRRLIQPAIELFTGIPSVVYGFVGMTVLIPALRHIFPMPFGFSVLAAGIVLAIMIFPTITTMAADAMPPCPSRGVKLLMASARRAGKRLPTSYFRPPRVVSSPASSWGWPALWAKPGCRMVIGQMKVFPTSLFLPASTLTTAISADMGGAMEGGEYNAALWTMALVLFLLSFLFIFVIHQINAASELKGGRS